MNCLFCNIIAGGVPSYRVYEDDDTLAFLDIRPNHPGHTLVVPKEHSENLYDMSDHALTTTASTVRKVARAIKKGVGADGINIAMNNEKAAGQIIFHPHVHIIPRFESDGFKHWPQKEYKEGEAAAVAEKIKAAL